MSVLVSTYADKATLRRRDGNRALFMTNNTEVVATKATRYQAGASGCSDAVDVVCVDVGAVGKIVAPAKARGSADFVKRTFGRVDGVVWVEWQSGATRTSTTRRALAEAALAKTQAARVQP